MENRTGKLLLFLCFMLPAVLPLHAQKPDAEKVDALIARYGAKYNSVVNKYNEVVYIGFNKQKKLSVYKDVVNEALFLSDRNRSTRERDVYFSGTFMDVQDVEAYSMHRNGKGYKKTDALSIARKDANTETNFYDDTKKVEINFDAPGAGSITHLNYRMIYNEPRFFGPFHFGHPVPVVEQEYKVVCDKKIKISYKLIGDSTELISFTKTESRDAITYTWKAATVKILSDASSRVDFKYYSPQVIIFIEEVNYGDRTEPFMGKVDELYNWYYSMVEPVLNDTNGDAYFRYFTDSLLKPCKTQEEKARTIYYWVQQHLKYIAIENGLGGFVPRYAEAIFKKRYGDCKDMSCLLRKLLNVAGIEAYVAWIGTRSIPYTYNEVPLPVTDNHMITVSYINGKTYFMDGTCDYCQFGVPSAMIQGKEAMLGMGPGKFRIEKVPEMPAEYSADHDSTYIWFEGNTLKGEGVLTYKGYRKVDMMYSFYRMSNKLSGEEKLKEFVYKGSNKVVVDQATINNYEHNDSLFVLHYKFHIPDYVTAVDNEQYLNMHLTRIFYHQQIEPDEMDVDVETDYRYSVNDVTVLALPKGYEASDVPQNSAYKHEQMGFAFSYEKLPGQVKLNRNLYLNYLVLNKKYFADWNACDDKIDASYRDQVVIRKTK